MKGSTATLQQKKKIKAKNRTIKCITSHTKEPGILNPRPLAYETRSHKMEEETDF